MKRVIAVYLAALCCASSLHSQQPKKSSAPLHAAGTAQYAGTFHPADGFSASGRSGRIGQRLILNNSALSPYYTIPGRDQEWVDDYYLQDLATDHSEQINGMEFIYCSSNSNPNGVQITMNFYDESIYCAGPVNWPIADCSYVIPGLPGGNNGALACWALTLDFWGVECNLTTDTFGTKLMGWGQVWDNDDSGPWIAQGDPGNTNYFTWWDTTVPNANAFQGCYWFGAPPDANFYIRLYGGPVDSNRYWAEDLGGTSNAFDNGLLNVDAQVKSGNTVTFSLTDPHSVGFDAMQLVYSSKPATRPIYYFGGHVLLHPAHLTIQPVAGLSQTYTIPPAVGDYYSQAACFSNGRLVGYSNALRHQNL